MSVTVIERTGTTSAGVIELQKTVSTGTIETVSIETITVGSRIWVTSYCPFHGLRGSVLNIHLFEERQIELRPDEPLDGVYRVQLDEVSKEPIEFYANDIELLVPVTISS